MDVSEKIKAIAEILGITKVDANEDVSTKLEAQELDNGTVIEAEVFEAEQEVFIVSDEERVALPIGEYKLMDGRVLVVQVDGVIFSIGEASEEEPEAPAENQEEVEQKEEVKTAKKTVESNIRETHFSQEDVDALNKEITELKEEKKKNQVDLAEAVANKEQAEIELSKKPAASKLNSAPVVGGKKQMNFTSEAKTSKGRILDGLQNLTK